jgi:hypothetical protein
MKRRNNAGSLLALLGDRSYSVILDDVTSGAAITLLGPTQITDLPFWTGDPPVSVPAEWGTRRVEPGAAGRPVRLRSLHHRPALAGGVGRRLDPDGLPGPLGRPGP